MLDMDEDQILSLCSGIGGLDLGLSAGLRAVGRSPRMVCMVEREAFPVAVLARQMQEGRMDECPLWLGDLQDLPLDELPAIDWITSGYPCQPFSAAGKRLGQEDPRHLWPTILRLVESLRPRGVFFENVAGHLTLGLDRVLQDLARCGFRSAFGLFTAAEVGAPHRRERVFILGLADGHGRGFQELSERHGEPNEGRTSFRDDARRCDSDVADGERKRLEGDIRHTHQEGREETRRPASRCREHRGGWPSRPREPQERWEPSRTTQPDMGRGLDGLPSRVDRLRSLGNAVVPQQAETAFVTLWKEVARC